MHQAIRAELLLPGNLREARSIGPRRNIARLCRLYRDVVAENESEGVVVAAIGEADWLPALEGRIEWKCVRLRLHRCEGDRRGVCHGLSIGRHCAGLTWPGRPRRQMCLQSRQFFRSY